VPEAVTTTAGALDSDARSALTEVYALLRAVAKRKADPSSPLGSADDIPQAEEESCRGQVYREPACTAKPPHRGESGGGP
jgi:hypothetical protein